MTSQIAPQQIYDELASMVQHYVQSLDSYTDAQFAGKPAADAWSLGQMYEHLLSSGTHFFLANTKRCLEQRKGQLGGDKNEYGNNLYKYNSFPPIKIKIPDVLRAPEPIAQSRDYYRQHLSTFLDDARNYIEPVIQDTGTYKCLQPAFGWLNAHEWFHLMDLHFKHHLRQKSELETWLSTQ